MNRGIPRFFAIALVPLLVFPAACGGREHIDGQSDGTDEQDSVEPDSIQDLPMDEGPPPCESDESCYDSDPCTEDRCDTPSGTCISTPVDEDGDGHSAATVAGIGCPGDDCDDGDPEVFPGAAPDCNGMRDMDCDGLLDGDEDGDGFWTVECPEGADCDDGAPGVHPGAYETCGDDIDQDCDGLVDERLNPLGEIRITEAEGDSTLPSLAWTGSEFMLVWRDETMAACDIMFTRVSAEGMAVDYSKAVSSRSCLYPWGPTSIAWTGSEFGIAWLNVLTYPPSEVVFALIDSYGNMITTDTRMMFDGTPMISEPAIAWNGSNFGLVSGNGDVHFYNLFTDAEVSDGSILDGTQNTAQPSMVWTGEDYYYSFYRLPYYIDVAIINSAGDRLADEWYNLWEVEQENPDLAWTGDGLVLAWEWSGSTRVARLNDTGELVRFIDVPAEAPYNLTRVPSLAWTGSEIGLAWDDVRGTDFFDPDLALEIYMSIVTRDCDSMSELYRITDHSGWSGSPDIVWTGSEFGIAWQDDRDGDFEIYFCRVAVCG